MKTYEVIGIPLSPPFQALEGRKVGDVFDAELDKETEEILVGYAALRVVQQSEKENQRETAQESGDDTGADEPRPEPAAPDTGAAESRPDAGDTAESESAKSRAAERSAAEPEPEPAEYDVRPDAGAESGEPRRTGNRQRKR